MNVKGIEDAVREYNGWFGGVPAIYLDEKLGKVYTWTEPLRKEHKTLIPKQYPMHKTTIEKVQEKLTK